MDTAFEDTHSLVENIRRVFKETIFGLLGPLYGPEFQDTRRAFNDARSGEYNAYELYAAIFVNLIATVLKFGDRTQIGAVHLATSLVADLQLIAAALVWGYASYVAVDGLTREATASVVSLSGGALVANIVSVTLLVVETVSFHRR